MAEKYVLVCQNADCKARRAGELLAALEERLKDSEGVTVKPYMCFGACQAGPNIVMYPQKVWYSKITDDDVEDIAAHAEAGPEVERLTKGVDRGLQELIYQLLDAGLF
jgi:(2Fe-2S) ferredoxin